MIKVDKQSYSRRTGSKSATRGASKRETKTPREFDVRWFYRAVYALLLVAVLTGMGYAGASVGALPVSRVLVNGEFSQVDKQLVERLVQPYLGSGFVLLDLDGIRSALKAQPWIFEVSVTRHWPDEIEIYVEEQKVIARWGDVGFLNFRGELFLPEQTKIERLNIAAMPLLSGPEGRSEDVMRYFRQLNDALVQHNLELKSLALNDRGSWNGQLTNGVYLYFGNDDVMENIRHFLNAYSGGLNTVFSKIKSVDMRHSKGFAVAWLEGANKS